MSNPVVATIVERMPRLALSDCYLAAGALFQSVWNCLSGRDARAGIRDYDLDYFDDTDLSWSAEDAIIGRAGELFDDVAATIELRNEARVHL